MEHFYQKIQGWFSFPDLYSHVVDIFPDGSHFVEVGVWKGTSASYMGVEILRSGKNIKFDCIDPFIAVGEEMQEFKITHEDLKNQFIENMKPLEGRYNLYTEGSPKVTELYKDKSLDFVFIDGSHKYEDVVEDIKSWIPKMKKGGILSGHDYTSGWTEVVKAVNDTLGEGDWKDPWGNSCWMIKI